MKHKNLITDYIPALLTAILILTFSVVRQQSFVKTLPTLITLAVQILLSRVNRFGFLIGGINALIYGISYFDEGLYFSCLFTVLISAPIQIYSFLNWSKKQISADRTELKVLALKKRIVVIVLTLIGWLSVYFGLRDFFANAQLPIFDSFHFTVGIIVSLLAAFRYLESQYLSMVSSCTALLMWIMICMNTPSNINYLIISCYNLFMIVKAVINWTKQYLQDKNEKELENEIYNVTSDSPSREQSKK